MGNDDTMNGTGGPQVVLWRRDARWCASRYDNGQKTGATVELGTEADLSAATDWAARYYRVDAEEVTLFVADSVTGPRSQAGADLTEEPTDPSVRVVDKDGDVWERAGDGWWLPGPDNDIIRTWDDVDGRFGPLTADWAPGDGREAASGPGGRP